MAFDDDAHILAVRLTGYGDMGGYLAQFGPLLPTGNQVKNIASVYRTPLIEVATKCVFTNTTFVSAYRGAGRPEGNYYIERTLDLAAAELGIDRLDLRRRNMIRKSDLPFKAASDMTYDCGDFLGVLKQALDAADYAGFKKRKRESKKRGLLRGFGIGCYLEVTAAPGKELGAIHFEADGTVTIVTGTLDFGMGHATTYAQILTDLLGVPFDRIRMVEGDSDRMAFGGGSGGSRSVMFVGTALTESAAIVIERGKQIASHVLEASPGDIEFQAGRFVIAGTDRSIGLLDLAARLRAGIKLAGRHSELARRRPRRQRSRSVGLSERVSYCRGRSRSGNRRRTCRSLFSSQRPRHGGQSACWSRDRFRAALCRVSGRFCWNRRSTIPMASW